MNKTELVNLLSEIAEKDTVEGHETQGHPCSVAIKALDTCFDDIKILQQIANKKVHGKSKKCQMLLGLSYGPEW